MASWQNDISTKCNVGKMVNDWNSLFIKWQVGPMSSWSNGNSTKLPVAKFQVEKSVRLNKF